MLFVCFIFELSIRIVHTLKMCTSDAAPEQSLVLFALRLGLVRSTTSVICDKSSNVP